MWNVLVSVPLDVISEELEGCLVSFDRVGQIISINLLGLFPQERSNSLDAAGTLHVLRIDQFFEMLLQILCLWSVFHIDLLQDSHEHCLESFQVPVLVDDLVDDSSLEHLVNFVSEKIQQVVHVVDGLSVRHIFAAPLGKQLLTQNEDEVFDVFITG